MSSMEAEYIAAMEAIWIRKFISWLGVIPSIDRPMDMYCDNTDAIQKGDDACILKSSKQMTNLADAVYKPNA
ncbi:hypothetical protein Tco_0833170 [Tanacetum coccineum]